jgi:muconate cycloisomerase
VTVRIESVETLVLDVPLRRPHRFSVLTIDHQSLLLVRVRTADGVVGTGEGVVPGGPWWGGESIETMAIVVDRYLAPLAVGGDASRPAGLRARMDRLVAGNPFAKAAVETAIWDAWARTRGVPLHELLGGRVRDSLPVTWALGADEPDAVIDEISAKLEAGDHRSFKLKMGAADPADDVARVEKVARSLSGRASLRVDLNGAWDEVTAARHLPRLEEAGLDLVEQPVPGHDLGAMERLAARLAVPVMADESVRTEHEAFEVARRRAADVVSLKVSKSGGFGVTARVAAVAGAAGLPCHGGTSIEGPVGTLAGLHLFCSLPAVTWGSELFGPLLLAEPLTGEPLDYRDGELHLPSGPGLGVELDEAAVHRFRRA